MDMPTGPGKHPMRLCTATLLAFLFTGSLALAQTTPASLKLQPDISNPAIPLPHDEKNNPIYAACLVSLRVNKDGNAENIHVGICSDDRIKAYVAASAAQFTFAPAIKKGKPVASNMTFTAMPHYPADALTPDPTPIDTGGDKNFFTKGGVKAPVAIYTPEAMYPRSAGDQKQSATVDINVIVTQYGAVKDARITKSSNHDFDQNALNAVQMYLFKPAMLNGKPVAVRVIVEVGFSIF